MQPSPNPDGSLALAEPITITCRVCARALPLEKMKRHKSMPHGRDKFCLACHRAYAREKRAARRMEGLCIEFGCSERAAPDRSLCAAHLTARTARDAADPERRRERERARLARLAARSPAEIEADRQRLRPGGVKQCRACRKTLDLAEFSENRTKADGLTDSCRRCAAESDARRRIAPHLPSWEDRDLFTCTFCGGEYEHIEHLLARRNGGADVSLNLAPACARCNYEKYVTPVDVWLDRLAAAGDPRGVAREVWESWPRIYLTALEDGTVVNVETGEVVEEGAA